MPIHFILKMTPIFPRLHLACLNEFVLPVFALDWKVPPKVPEARLVIRKATYGDELQRGHGAVPISPYNDKRAEKQPSISRGV